MAELYTNLKVGQEVVYAPQLKCLTPEQKARIKERIKEWDRMLEPQYRALEESCKIRTGDLEIRMTC